MRARRRAPFAAAALALTGAVLANGCGASFLPLSKLTTLRVLAVTIDQPYPQPGDTVTFDLFTVDARPGSEVATPELNTVWFTCEDPPGDQYFACFAVSGAGGLFGIPDGAPIPDRLCKEDLEALPPGVVPIGPTLTYEVPDDLISRRPKPTAGPYYGLTYAFFIVCDGCLEFVPPPDEVGRAGYFPLRCVTPEGEVVGPDGFTVGYTQIYAFEDARSNENPLMTGMTLGGAELSDDPGQMAVVAPCAVTDEERQAPLTCGATDPFERCPTLDLTVTVPDDVAEPDPYALRLDGTPFFEAVWVSYFTEGGDLSSAIKLVADAESGLLEDFSTKWLPPAQEGPVDLYAVIRDNRGGSSIIKRTVLVSSSGGAGGAGGMASSGGAGGT